MILDEIKIKAQVDTFIRENKTQVRWKLKEKNKIKLKIDNIFSICNEVLMSGKRVVMPGSLQKRMFKGFHTGHPGISTINFLMHSYVYWPNMDKDIERLVKSCTCAIAAKSPPVKFHPWPKTDTL